MKIRKFPLLPKPHRLIEEKDFKRVMKHGRSFFVGECGIKILKKYPLSASTRVGIIVPKKIAKTIVKRNRIKRQARNIFAHFLSTMPTGYDVVFLARPKFLDLTFDEMQRKIDFLLHTAVK